MRNPILEKKIIPVAHPTDNQKSVMAKIVAAATPELAAADISDNPHLSAARDMLVRLDMIELNAGGAFLTDRGNEMMISQNLVTPDGQLTDDGQTAAHGEEEAKQAASPEPTQDLERGMDFDDELGDDEFDLENGDDEYDMKKKIDLDMEAEKKVHEPRESFTLLKDLRETAIIEGYLGHVPPDLLDKLTQSEKQELSSALDGRSQLHDHESLYSKLYSHFVREMPYGTAKARTGDPDEWIINRLTTGDSTGEPEDDPRLDR